MIEEMSDKKNKKEDAHILLLSMLLFEPVFDETFLVMEATYNYLKDRLLYFR